MVLVIQPRFIEYNICFNDFITELYTFKEIIAFNINLNMMKWQSLSFLLNPSILKVH